MTPEREEELLAIAGDLARRLESIPVPLLTGAGRAADGISPSCVGNVAAFLASDRDMESFRHFVSLLDQLDAIVGQNQKNPKAEHKVLKRELLRLLKEQPELETVEHFYVISWVQRLLRPGDTRPNRTGRSAQPAVNGRKNPTKPGAGFGQIANAFQRLKQNR